MLKDILVNLANDDTIERNYLKVGWRDILLDHAKQNYASAILIAWKLYCKFIKSIDFNEFERLITDDYNAVGWEINAYK